MKVELRPRLKTGLVFQPLLGKALIISSAAVLLFYIFTMKPQETFAVRASENIGDTISFSGYIWTTKDSYGRHTGPGYNYFSGSKDNVWTDDEGKLHLRLTNRDDKWYCPEVRLQQSLGYGRYYFYLDPLPQNLDKDIVIGLFFYDREDTSNFHKEIDIEFSKWGKEVSKNSQYVIQPKEEKAFRFETDFTKRSKHMIELRNKKIRFKSEYDSADPKIQPYPITSYSEKPDYYYTSDSEKISMNVWLYHTVEPSNLKEFEVIISKFEFKKFWSDSFFHRNN